MSTGLLVIYLLFSFLHLVRPLLKVHYLFENGWFSLRFPLLGGERGGVYFLAGGSLAFIQFGRLKIRVQAKRGSGSQLLRRLESEQGPPPLTKPPWKVVLRTFSPLPPSCRLLSPCRCAPGTLSSSYKLPPPPQTGEKSKGLLPLKFL